MKTIYLLIITYLFSVNLGYSATPKEFREYFGSQTPKILDLYRKGSKQVSFKVYDECLSSSCAQLSKMYSFLPSRENESRSLYTRLVMKPKPQKNTLKAIIDDLIAEKEAEQIWNLRFKNLKSRTHILRKCGFPNVINPNQTIQKAQKDHDETLLLCLEDQMAQLKTKHEANKLKRQTFKNVRKDLQNYDCTTVTEAFMLKVCTYFNNLR